jgi:transcriptional regulator with XRE-family HTH domain
MKLKDARLDVGLMSTYVARELGIACSTLNRIENGFTPLGKLKMEKLAEMYKLPLDKLKRIAETTLLKK